ncbi:MAG: methylenetetrahydrofolate--tRNA-(uracil(54)-C(5))-methyltransferase (FADH(2)-oxidizing) TrmFO [Deltaproteobacteria bacterium]|jgi:methylenetetrahydrofolate--tRNA-(uracil-5-)-methyltransferase|nr:methylenetetrahydrofolate--tRNA-(uracil(54)-C(5))-methyltransferase (FADH(2)-oxidizing) TrmFO [Deltaproteobacteria bacterium]
MAKRVTIIGGGLAGCEAAWRAAALGLDVDLREMKPQRFSPAHRNTDLAELVCSNSFRSDSPDNAVGLLKEELRAMGSLTMRAADLTRVPAGKALAVDRDLFSAKVTGLLLGLGNVKVTREEVPGLDPSEGVPQVIATGPLTSEPMAAFLAGLTGSEGLSFYDALAPIVTDESLDRGKLFLADRYGGGGEGDYLNCPLGKSEFGEFLEALLEADRVGPRPFESERYFEGCLPIEVMAQRGPKTLLFGPMKPVGLIDPRTGSKPHAVIQLRRENLEGSLWNMVGFQTRLTRPAQERVFRMIPGLGKAEFARYGAIHRNTFLDAPKALDPFQGLRARPGAYVGGQLSGVEGYVESAAHGLLAGENAARAALGLAPVVPPQGTAIGALASHLLPFEGRGPFAPSNVNFGLFRKMPEGTPKRDLARLRVERARDLLPGFLESIDYAQPR